MYEFLARLKIPDAVRQRLVELAPSTPGILLGMIQASRPSFDKMFDRVTTARVVEQLESMLSAEEREEAATPAPPLSMGAVLTEAVHPAPTFRALQQVRDQLFDALRRQSAKSDTESRTRADGIKQQLEMLLQFSQVKSVRHSSDVAWLGPYLANAHGLVPLENARTLHQQLTAEDVTVAFEPLAREPLVFAPEHANLRFSLAFVELAWHWAWVGYELALATLNSARDNVQCLTELRSRVAATRQGTGSRASTSVPAPDPAEIANHQGICKNWLMLGITSWCLLRQLAPYLNSSKKSLSADVRDETARHVMLDRAHDFALGSPRMTMWRVLAGVLSLLLEVDCGLRAAGLIPDALRHFLETCGNRGTLPREFMEKCWRFSVSALWLARGTPNKPPALCDMEDAQNYLDAMK
jgi:hypothetical protein